MQSASDLFDTLNADYLAVHKSKEDLFWATYMATSNDDAAFARAEESYKNFISGPARFAAVRAAGEFIEDGREIGARRAKT